MIDVGRLSEVGSDRERRLLQAAADISPSEESIRAAERALGLVPRALVAGALTGAAVKSVRWSWTSTPALASLAAIVGVASVGVVVAVGHGHGAFFSSPRAASRAGEPTQAAASGTGAAPAIAPVPAERSGGAAAPRMFPSLPAANGEPVSPKRRVADDGLRVERGAPDGTRGMDAQVALLDRARGLLTGGSPAAAERVLDEYERRFPGATLAEEAAMLRAQCAATEGDRTRALSLARRFLVDHPQSVHADQAHALVSKNSN